MCRLGGPAEPDSNQQAAPQVAAFPPVGPLPPRAPGLTPGERTGRIFSKEGGHVSCSDGNICPDHQLLTARTVRAKCPPRQGPVHSCLCQRGSTWTALKTEGAVHQYLPPLTWDVCSHVKKTKPSPSLQFSPRTPFS